MRCREAELHPFAIEFELFWGGAEKGGFRWKNFPILPTRPSDRMQSGKKVLRFSRLWFVPTLRIAFSRSRV